MADSLGVSIGEFTQAVVDSYKKGFNDAIECLKLAQSTIEPEKMKKDITEKLIQQNKIKAEW